MSWKLQNVHLFLFLLFWSISAIFTTQWVGTKIYYNSCMAFWKEFCASRNVCNLILPRKHQISCYVFAPNSLITFMKTNFEILDQLTTFDGGSINPNISILICVPLTVARTARKMPPLILHTLAPYTAKTKPTIPIIFSH